MSRLTLIPCEKCKRATKHDFIEPRAELVDGKIEGFELVYGCRVCKTLRRYGFEEPLWDGKKPAQDDDE